MRKNQTYFSAASVQAKGIITNNELDRLNFSVRNTANLLDNRLTWDVNAMYVNTEEQNMFSQGQYFNPLIPIYLFPLSDDIERYKVFERFDPTRNFNTQFWPYGDMGFQMQNPYWIIHRNLFQVKKDRFVIGTGLKYKINSWLDVAGRVRLDQNTTSGERKFFASTSGLFASEAGAYYKNTAITRQMYSDVLATATKDLNNDLTLSATVGASIMDVQYNMENYGGNLLSVPNLFAYQNVNQTQATVQQERFRDQTQSVFGTAQLSYRNMVFVDVTGRTDWSSALANTTASSIVYPSVGASAILTDLLKFRSPILSFAKIRGTYSEVGNAPSRFVSIATYPIIGGFPTTTSYRPATSLRPEGTRSVELGLNLRFLRNKINLDVTVYRSNTFNQLFNPTLAPSTGFSSFYINAGEVVNKGIEVSLGGSMKLGAVDWSSNVTLGLNRNRINKLLANYKDELTAEPISVDSLSMGGTGSYMMALVKGGSMGDIYVNSLAVDEHGFIKVGLVSQTVTANSNHYIKAGNANPRYNLGWRNSFRYKDFQLDLLVNARIGGVGVSVTQAIMDRFGVSKASADARDAGGVIINGEKLPAQPYYEVVGGGVAGVGSRYVYSASNVRLAEASLNYNLPQRWFGHAVKGVTVGVNGRNLFLLTKAPFDPEAAASTGTYYQGIDYFMQPSLRSVGFNVKVQF
ncbi:MAG: TonB-dependent receptor [Chitinophagaceae bacterium]|nr:TonB-dependent receptor [Chitinophagaceae bacterium]